MFGAAHGLFVNAEERGGFGDIEALVEQQPQDQLLARGEQIVRNVRRHAGLDWGREGFCDSFGRRVERFVRT